MTAVINLIIAHGHPHLLFILQNIIRSYEGFRVVGKTGNYRGLMQMATALKPDVIIADIELSGLMGFTAFQQPMAGLNQPKIILSWRHPYQPFICEAIKAGCAGCIIHDAIPAEYYLAVKQAMKGEVFYCSHTERLINGIKNWPGTYNVPAEVLSEIQFKIMYCIWLGYNSKEIALATGLTKETVDTYLLEKHYYKIARHPGCGKFTIDIANVVYWIKEAGYTEPQSISGSLNFKRCMDTGTVIGCNREGESTTFITVITDAGGTIKTAFPGVLRFKHL